MTMKPVWPTRDGDFAEIVTDEHGCWHVQRGGELFCIEPEKALDLWSRYPDGEKPNTLAMLRNWDPELYKARARDEKTGGVGFALQASPPPVTDTDARAKVASDNRAALGGFLIIVLIVVALAGGFDGSDSSDPRGAQYCVNNPYARDCPQENTSDRQYEDDLAKAYKQQTGQDYNGFKDGLP